MKTISLRQPWAWAIFHGKPVENRTWKTQYTGCLLIHAAKTFDLKGYQWLLKHGHLLDAEIPKADKFVYGAVIGRVTMVACVVQYPSPFFFGPYGHVYTEPIEFINPIPHKGLLKMFDVSDKLIEE